MGWLSGKKTYLIAVGMIIYAVVLYAQGQNEQALKLLLEALGLAGLRAGVTKSGPG